MSKPASPTLIGAFVLGALALVIGGIVVLGGGKFFERTTPVVMYFKGSVAGLTVGSPVNFRGVKVGEVTNVFIRYAPEQPVPIEIPVFAEFSSENVRIVGPQDEKHEFKRATDDRLRELVEQGLRAQLALPSLVTGQTTVTLDFFPGTSAALGNSYPDTVEIPTVPSTLQELQTTLQQMVAKLSQLPLDELIADTRNFLSGASTLVNDPNIPQALANANRAMADLQGVTHTLSARLGTLMASLDAALATTDRTLQNAQQVLGRLDERSGRLIDDADRTLQTAERALGQAERVLSTVNGLIAPGSTLNYELVSALREATTAARSLRSLTDELQRNPNALIFGRPGPANPR